MKCIGCLIKTKTNLFYGTELCQSCITEFLFNKDREDGLLDLPSFLKQKREENQSR